MGRLEVGLGDPYSCEAVAKGLLATFPQLEFDQRVDLDAAVSWEAR